MRITTRVLGQGFGLAALVVLAVPAGACSDSVDVSDGWVIWITTDAPVPNLVDHLQVELLDDAGNLACDACKREVALQPDPTTWPRVERFAPPGGSKTPRLRVRLYRERSLEGGVPAAATTLERVGVLPPAAGEVDVDLRMYAECIGLPSDAAGRMTCAGPARVLVPEAEIPRGRGFPGFDPGTWSRSRQRACAFDPPAGLSCVPGGLFVLGDRADPSALPERYVALAPFYLHTHEMPVGVVRGLVRDGKVGGAPVLRAADPTLRDSACNWLGPDDAANDALPVNCVTQAFAASVCTALELRLPTEPEWEWAAGNALRETRWPWGDGRDPCETADVGRGRDAFAEAAACRSRPGKEAPGLPEPPSATDITTLEVTALGGGLAEWTSTRFAPYDAPCWSPAEPFLVDPSCAAGDLVTVRGSGWSDAPELAASTARRGVSGETASPGIGFRCALYTPE